MAGSSAETDARLTRLETSVQRIEGQLSQLVADFCEFKSRVESMLQDHQVVLYGDSSVPGLIAKSAPLQELWTALKGYGKDPGLIAEIHSLMEKKNKWEDNFKWFVRLALGALLADIILNLVRLTF